MKFFVRVFFLLFLNAELCCRTYSTNICSSIVDAIRQTDFKIDYTFSTWSKLVKDKEGMANYICNIADGIKEGARRHISLVFLSSSSNEFSEGVFLPYIFVSGTVPNSIKQDIIGAVKFPTKADFWTVFKDINSSYFSCNALQAQSLAHSERAACLYVLTHKNDILKLLPFSSPLESLDITIYNVKKICLSCKNFLKDAKNIGLKFNKDSSDNNFTTNVNIVDALKQVYNCKVKISVRTANEKDFCVEEHSV